MTTLTQGQPVPAFTAASTAGDIQSTDWRGHYTVLFFYPRNNTPGCTTESKDFRDQHDAFTAANCKVFGISRDTLRSHQGVVNKLELPYPLIADPDETVCNQFGVIKPKNMFGKQVRGIERSTFLLDPQGNIIEIWRKVKVAGHVADVLATLNQHRQ